MEDWHPVRRACRELAGELPEIAGAVTRLIRETIPSYAAISEREHVGAVRNQLRVRLAALAEGRELEQRELTAAAELAAVRAAEGIPIDALIAAYQTGDREMWQLLVKRGGSTLAPLLPRLGSLIFAFTSATSTVMARAHSRVARDIDGGRITLGHQLLAFLDDPAEGPAAALAATRLGLDPQGDFVCLVWRPDEATSGSAVEPVAALMTDSPGLAVRMAADGSVEILEQADGSARPGERVTARVTTGRWGVGQTREGLGGAALSLVDARLAVTVADERSPVVWFAERWRDALVLAEAQRLRPLLCNAVDVARAHPHLVDAVQAFAAADMTVAATAKIIHLHANSVIYRLRRWANLTGLDPRTFDGLADSVVACRLAERPG